VVSILTREGSGTTRGWKIFDPTKADFLNTKKILYPGDDVLVNAKVLPMDFPVQLASSELNLTLEEGVQRVPLTVDIAEKVGSWKVASITGISSPTYLLNGSAPAALSVNQVLILALNDVLEVEGEVATVGTVRLTPNV